MIRTGNTAKYNYGDESENKKHYGQPTSPLYNVSRIPKDIPLLFGYGGKDSLTFDVNDVKHLLDNLKDHQKDKLVVKYKEVYAHFDSKSLLPCFLVTHSNEENLFLTNNNLPHQKLWKFVSLALLFLGLRWTCFKCHCLICVLKSGWEKIKIKITWKICTWKNI